MKEKLCYICLPINKFEDSLFERAKIACEEVVKLGYKPITPMEINNETPETIYNHDKNGNVEMGNDITALLESDAIYCCKGFTESKGCMTEYNCAKIYGKEIFYQKSNPDSSLLDNIKAEYRKLCAIYNETNRIGDIEEINEIRNQIRCFKIFVNDNLDIKI